MSPTAVSLQEWETLRPDRGSALADQSFKGKEAIRRLAEQLTEGGRIEVLELARGLELRATSFVGRVSLGELTVTVHPKLSGAPLLQLVRYAYGLRHLDLYGPVAYASEKWTFQDLLIQQLTAEATELLARGVYRDYTQAHAELANPRGRIEFDFVARRAHQSSATLPCVYHPRSEDTILNQIVLAGLAYASRLTDSHDLRTRLKRLMKAWSIAVSAKRLNAGLLLEAQRAMDRRTTAYRSALVVIDLLLRAEGPSLEGQAERMRLPGFLFDMNRFFQTLISRFLREHLEGYDVENEDWMRGLFDYDPDRNPQNRRAPIQRPDFVIRLGKVIVAILDAKYRDLWGKSLPREMLYQLALYALGQRGSSREAVILYPTLDPEAREQAILVRDPVSGVHQAQVILRPVNLLYLERLLRGVDWETNRCRVALARQLSFGSAETT